MTTMTTTGGPVTPEPGPRHPGTEHLLEMLRSSDELLSAAATRPLTATERVERSVNYTAHEVAAHLQDGPELTAGLRHLLEAKDCFVRQALVDSRPK